jgi:hypothetical protein
MDVNDDAFFLNNRVVLAFFASKLAPKGEVFSTMERSAT